MSRIRAVLITGPLIALATIVYGSASMLVSFFDRGGRRQNAVGQAWARMLLRIAGVTVSTVGLEKIAPGGSYVIASNHVSYMDTPVIFSYLPVQFRFLAKSELFKIPFLGGHLQRAGHIAVPLEARAALKAMAEASRTLKERGISLLVFPEGGRSETGIMQEFKDGAAYLAIKAQVPLVPIRLSGMYEVLPMHSMHMRPGKVTLRVGDPIPTEGLTLADRGRITRELYERVTELECETLPA